MKYACPKCRLAFAPKQTGVIVEVMSDSGIYQYWAADLLACPGCQVEILSGFGSAPIIEHRAGYLEPRLAELPRYQVWYTRREKERAGKT
jgi:hypothetical protein